MVFHTLLTPAAAAATAAAAAELAKVSPGIFPLNWSVFILGGGSEGDMPCRSREISIHTLSEEGLIYKRESGVKIAFQDPRL